MLARNVIAEYDGRVALVVEDFGSSELARRFGVTQYPAVWVDEALVARPNDFYSWETEDGRYTPWRDADSHRRFQADLRTILDRALAGGTVDGYTPEEAAAGADELRTLPDFALVDLDGQPVGPADLRGKPALVEFWATWCPPCRSTLEWLDDLRRRHQDEIAVLGVAVESEEAAVRDLMAELGVGFRTAMGSPETPRAFGNVITIPTLFLFDADGDLAEVFYGAPEDLHERVEAALEQLDLGENDDPADSPSARGAGPVAVPFSSDRWQVRAEEHRLETYRGRESLWLRGGAAWIEDVDLTDGVIEFDIAVDGARGFSGALWRLVDAGNGEQFYLRPHQSGNPDANQYTPMLHGRTAWQLYHGDRYSAPIEYRFDEWMPIRIVFRDRQAEIYVDSAEPVLVTEMKGPVRPGKVGVLSGYAPARFADFRYTEGAPELRGALPPPPEALPGTVMSWQVSEPFPAGALEGRTELTGTDRQRTWTPLAADSDGITNLSRLHPVSPEADTVFARLDVRSDAERTVRFTCGYSDRLRLYLNGRLLYGGSNEYRSRDYRYLGTIGLFDDVYLPLRAGDNELWLAVSETTGGWGVQCRFQDLDGITVRQEDG